MHGLRRVTRDETGGVILRPLGQGLFVDAVDKFLCRDS